MVILLLVLSFLGGGGTPVLTNVMHFCVSCGGYQLQAPSLIDSWAVKKMKERVPLFPTGILIFQKTLPMFKIKKKRSTTNSCWDVGGEQDAAERELP